MRRFKKTNSDLSQYPLKNSFLVLDPLSRVLAVLELMMIFIDYENLGF